MITASLLRYVNLISSRGSSAMQKQPGNYLAHFKILSFADKVPPTKNVIRTALVCSTHMDWTVHVGNVVIIKLSLNKLFENCVCPAHLTSPESGSD